VQNAWARKVNEKLLGSLAEEEDDGEEEQEDNPMEPPLEETYYQVLEERCREWVNTQQADPRRMGREEYQAAYERGGYGTWTFPRRTEGVKERGRNIK
jgi:hypothetical protein